LKNEKYKGKEVYCINIRVKSTNSHGETKSNWMAIGEFNPKIYCNEGMLENF